MADLHPAYRTSASTTIFHSYCAADVRTMSDPCPKLQHSSTIAMTPCTITPPTTMSLSPLSPPLSIPASSHGMPQQHHSFSHHILSCLTPSPLFPQHHQHHHHPPLLFRALTSYHSIIHPLITDYSTTQSCQRLVTPEKPRRHGKKRKKRPDNI